MNRDEAPASGGQGPISQDAKETPADHRMGKSRQRRRADAWIPPWLCAMAICLLNNGIGYAYVLILIITGNRGVSYAASALVAVLSIPMYVNYWFPAVVRGRRRKPQADRKKIIPVASGAIAGTVVGILAALEYAGGNDALIGFVKSARPHLAVQISDWGIFSLAVLGTMYAVFGIVLTEGIGKLKPESAYKSEDSAFGLTLGISGVIAGFSLPSSWDATAIFWDVSLATIFALAFIMFAQSNRPRGSSGARDVTPSSEGGNSKSSLPDPNLRWHARRGLPGELRACPSRQVRFG